MTSLPNAIRYAPRAFYAAGLIYFVGSVVVTHVLLGSILPTGENGFPSLALIQSWLASLAVGAILVGIGIIARILIAICDNVRFGVDR